MAVVSLSQFARLSDEQRQGFASFGSPPGAPDDFFLVPTPDRYPGTYILGVQGSGKTGLLQNLINQDIQAGHAVIVIDPHGDLTDNCVSLVPADRLKNTYLLDMQDEAYPFGVNLFAAGRLTTDVALTQAVNRILHVFKVLWPEVMSQQNLPRYLLAATIALLANPGSTLVDMYGFLLEQAYRDSLLVNVSDPTVRRFWKTQFDNLAPHEQRQRIAPLIGRLEALFMGRSLVRNIVGQRRTTINFRRAIEQHQILFIKLPVKTLGQDAELIGTILLSQIHAAVFSFADVPAAQRPGVSLYVDEFQHFATSDFSELLTEGRKFGVRVTVAHQHRSQLPVFLRDSTMTTRTKVCFRLTPDDSREMAHVFPSDEARVQPEDIEVHPSHYLLTHPSNDEQVRAFAETYLHPLQSQKRGAGRVEIDPWKLGAPGLMDIASGGRPEHTRVPDPTYQLDSLLYDVMQSGNANLPISPEIALGFSNCGAGFYKVALGLGYNDRDLTINVRFPRALVVQAPDGSLRWTRKPEGGIEQFYHFIYHLRMVMQYLADKPVGKATVSSPAETAKNLTMLPNRAMFIRSGNDGDTLYTQDTMPVLSREASDYQKGEVLAHTRATYCRPKADVVRDLIPQYPQPQAPGRPPGEPPEASGGVYANIPPKQPPGQPAIRWEEIDIA